MRRFFAILFLCALAAGYLGWSGKRGLGTDVPVQPAALPTATTTPAVLASEPTATHAGTIHVAQQPTAVLAPPTKQASAAALPAALDSPSSVVRFEGDRYEASEVIEHEGSVDLTKPGHYRQARLVRVPGEKYPLLVVHDEVEVLPARNVRLVKQEVIVADHVMLKPKPGVSDATLLTAIQKLGGSIRKKMPASGVWLIAFPQPSLKTVPQALQSLAALPDVTAIVEPDYVVHANVVLPSDTSFTTLWGMNNTGQSGGKADADIDAPEAWEFTTGNRSVLVGVVDTGIDPTHPDLAANMWTNPNEIANNNLDDDNNGYIDDIRGWDFANDDNNPVDDNLHGTHCAGTIGAEGNNARGVVGVCWQVSLVGLKFLSGSGSGTTSDATEAIAYGTSIGVNMTSNSWGGGGYSQLMKNAIDAAGAADILFIAAAGNETANSDLVTNYPSGYDSANIITVAATTRTDALSYFSNYGVTTVDLAAPGSEIYSTAPGGGYATLSGTSMATPHVAGACALLKAFNPSLSAQALKSALLGSVDPLPALTDKCLTGGRLNVFQALLRTSEINLDPPSAFSVTAPLAGPVPASQQTYTLTNYGTTATAWSAAVDQAWVTIIGNAAGSLEPGESMELILEIVPDEALLQGAGRHEATLTVLNEATDRSVTRPIVIDLIPPPIQEFPLDSDPGWSRTGQWAFGPPLGNGGSAHGYPDPSSAATGSNVLGVNLSGDYASTLGGPYWITAGPFDLSEYKDTRLAYQRWLNSDYEPWVSAMIEVSTDGEQWTRIWRNSSNYITDKAWQRVEHDLSFIADKQPQVWVRWGYSVNLTTNVWALSGWNLDDIQILGVPDRTLTLTGPAEATEGDPATTITLTVSPVPKEALVLKLQSSAPDQASVPSTVEVPAGESSITFPLTIEDDALADGSQSVTLSASRAGWPQAQLKLDVHDNDSAVLQVSLPETITEGSSSTRGTVSLAEPAARALRVSLTSSLPTSVSVATSVTIPQGRTSATFLLSTSNDTLINEPQMVTISASVRNWTNHAEGTISFVDDESHDLTLDLPPALLENIAGFFSGTVRIGGTLTKALTVDVRSTDILKLTVSPTQMVIPAGATSQTFTLNPGDDSVINGLRRVLVTARAQAFNMGSAEALIYDNETPALPGYPSPEDGEERAAPSTRLTWEDLPYTGAKPSTWDVYFGTTPAQAMSRRVGSMSQRQWSLGRTQRGTTYYWRVVARRGAASAASPVWSFTIPSTGRPVRYVWGGLGAAQVVNRPFTASLTAYDEFGNIATLDGGSIDVDVIDGNGASRIGNLDMPPVTLVNGRWSGALRFKIGIPEKVALYAMDERGYSGQSRSFPVRSTLGQIAITKERSQVTEGDGKIKNVLSLSLPKPTKTPLTIAFDTTKPDKLANTSVVMPAGTQTMLVMMNVLDDIVLDGPQDVGIEAHAPGYMSGYTSLQVLDNEINTLSLSLPGNVVEGTTTDFGACTVTLDRAAASDVRVLLTSSDMSELIPPDSVVIPKGQTSKTFQLTAVQDPWLDLTQGVTLTATVPGWPSAAATIDVLDDEPQTLSLLLTSTANEGQGEFTGIVGLSAPTEGAFTITLSTSDITEIGLPTTVTVPAKASSASFSVDVVDDTETDGTINVNVTTSAAEMTAVSKAVSVRDNDAHHFTFGSVPTTRFQGSGGNVAITAYDINDAVLPEVKGPVSLRVETDGGDTLACTPTQLNFVTGSLSVSASVTQLGTGARFIATGPSGSGASNAFDVVAGPVIQVDLPAAEERQVPQGLSVQRTVTVHNVGTHSLIWSAQTAVLSGLPFAKLSPSSGTVEPGAHAVITLTLDATDHLKDATAISELQFTSNSGMTPLLKKTIDMTVGPPVQRFVWSALPSTCKVNEPLAVTLTAINPLDNLPYQNFEGQAMLGSNSNVQREIVKGSDNSSLPFPTQLAKNRTQIIYLKEELGGPAVLNSLSFESLGVSRDTMTFAKIRLKHTPKASTTEMNKFESTGWTTVLDHGILTVPEAGWQEIFFDRPFGYNGEDNLMVDITYTASAYPGYARPLMACKTVSPWRTLTFSTLNNYGDPLTWTVAPNGSYYVPNLRFGVASASEPTLTGKFTKGQWTGTVRLTKPGVDQRLTAAQAYVYGLSNYIAVTSNGTAALEITGTVTEGQGATPNAGILRISTAQASDTVFTLQSSDPAQLTAPASIILPAGETYVSFSLTAVDDTLLEDQHSAQLSAYASGFAEVKQSITIKDNDITTLQLSLPAEITEGAGLSATASLGRVAAADFTVQLSSPSPRVVVPASAIIAKGSSSVTFAISAPNNSLLDGDESISISATCPLTPGFIGSVLVRDNEARTLRWSGVPATLYENATNVTASAVVLAGLTTAPLTVTIESSDPTQVPSQQIIVPQGAATASFQVKPVNDTLYDGRQTVTLTAKASTFTDSTPATIQVWDDDPHHFDILAIPSPQLRNSPITLQVIARDVNGLAIETRTPEFSFIEAGHALPQSTVTQPSWSQGSFTAQFAVNAYASAAVLQVRDPLLGAASLSNSFAISYGAVSSLEWTLDSASQTTDRPFTVTLTALDAGGNTVGNFNGAAAITLAPGDAVSIGSGAAYTLWSPLGSTFAATRTQALYTAAELGPLATLGSLTLEVTSKPAFKLENYTIRVKPTDRTSFASSDSFDAADWTTVFTGTLDLAAIGPKTFLFNQRYVLDKTKNLLVDLSFQNNGGGAYNGSVRAHSLSANHLLLSTGSTSPFGFTQGVGNNFRPHAVFDSGTPSVTITPGQTGAFVNGVWTGSLTITPAAKAIKLRATSGNVSGMSPLIDVQPLATP